MPLWRRKSQTVWHFNDNFSIYPVSIPDQTVLAAFGYTIPPSWYGQLVHACFQYTAAAGPGLGRFAVRSTRGGVPIFTGQSSSNLPAATVSRASWSVIGNTFSALNLVIDVHMIPDHFYVYPGDRVEFISTNTAPGDVATEIFFTFKRWELP